MKRNISELERKMIMLLKNNSRMSNSELAEELKVSRITARKVMETLIKDGIIKNFTISMGEEDRNLALILTDKSEDIPEYLILEKYNLMDGTSVSVIYFEDLVKLKNVHVKRIEIASSRTINEDASRNTVVHCDYCGREITDNPITLQIARKNYFACCPNCEKDLRKRKEILAEHL